MELFVRSQDKEFLVKVGRVFYNRVILTDPYTVLHKISTGQGTLGNYETKERCLEILDEIENEIKKASRDYIIWQSNSIFALSESDILEMNNQLQKSGIINVPKEVNAEFVPKGSQVVIYQMPEK